MSEIKLEGLDKILERLSSMASPQQVEASLGKACALVERSAKQKAPKGVTGDLRKFISSKIETVGNTKQGIVFSPLEYAPYVEYGTGLFAEEGGRTDVPWHYQDEKGEWHSTSGQEPHPFMRPALEENRAKIIQIFKEGLKE